MFYNVFNCDYLFFILDLTLPLPDLPRAADVDSPSQQTTAQDVAHLSPMATQTTNKWFLHKDTLIAAPESATTPKSKGTLY